MAEKQHQSWNDSFSWLLKAVGFSPGDRAWGYWEGGTSGHSLTFSQAPSLSGASLLSFVKFAGSGRCSSASLQPQQKIRIKKKMDYGDPWWSVKMNSGWDTSTVLMLNVLMLVILLWLCKRISLSLGNTHWGPWPLKEMVSSTYFQMI